MAEVEESQTTLDLSKKCLKKVPKSDDPQTIKTLILDDNELQKIDNIDSYLKIEKLSLCKNQLLRMYGVCRLHQLKELNLSYNGILTIEGLKELTQLVHLNLEGNNIKTIEHLNVNLKLEILNLSENSIGNITDISFLKNLKELHLYGNRLSHLRQCDKYLPNSLEILTLAKNNLTDLNEICTLSHLNNLQSLSISENPCVQMTGNIVGFDYRPFVLNWCMSLKLIDGFVVNPIESLKAEWLYSQGRGRQFRVGDQVALARYLSSVCPLSGETLENENERKLRLILSKAQQHQRQLQEEISGTDTNTSGSNSPSSVRRKGPSSRIQSPRFSRLSGRIGSPDSSMSNSFSGMSTNFDVSMTPSTQMTTSLIENIKNDSLMTQSLDQNNLITGHSKNFLNQDNNISKCETPTQQHIHQLNQALNSSAGPLAAASKMMPVPESLMSPDCFPNSIIKGNSNKNADANVLIGGSTNTHAAQRKIPTGSRLSKGSPKMSHNSSNHHIKRNDQSSSSPILGGARKTANNRNTDNIMKYNKNSNHSTPPISSDEDSDYINIDKLKTIRNKAAQKNQKKKSENHDVLSTPLNKTTENSVILIQKMWRGFYTRKKTQHIVEILQKKRTQEYIVKLSQDMESTKAALENERKIQHLQMQAINALWKKVSQMGPTTTTATVTTDPNNTSDQPSITATNQPDGSSTEVVQDLTKTCTALTNQVQQLQSSMRDVLNCMTLFCNISTQQNLTGGNKNEEKIESCSTQTEIVAVNTPQVENLPFPFTGSKFPRPSTLPLDSNSPKSESLQNNEKNDANESESNKNEEQLKAN